MTIDVNVKATNDDFLDEIDEIIEDTMVQIFFLQPEDETLPEPPHRPQGIRLPHRQILHRRPARRRKSPTSTFVSPCSTRPTCGASLSSTPILAKPSGPPLPSFPTVARKRGSSSSMSSTPPPRWYRPLPTSSFSTARSAGGAAPRSVRQTHSAICRLRSSL